MFSIASSRILQSCANFSIIVVTMKETIFCDLLEEKRITSFKLRKYIEYIKYKEIIKINIAKDDPKK